MVWDKPQRLVRGPTAVQRLAGSPANKKLCLSMVHGIGVRCQNGTGLYHILQVLFYEHSLQVYTPLYF